ncbi:WRKY DNA-binding protein 46 [Striga asiatica]|uniref:WRKY DNA-binding protein 46 n=1 Tax=Striga asiatica TaxID=4170 RepID=A0A5A7PYV2_STRAF|nr:WRKY DNA-binding protein 46 [Striga asiatica]
MCLGLELAVVVDVHGAVVDGDIAVEKGVSRIHTSKSHCTHRITQDALGAIPMCRRTRSRSRVGTIGTASLGLAAGTWARGLAMRGCGRRLAIVRGWARARSWRRRSAREDDRKI